MLNHRDFLELTMHSRRYVVEGETFGTFACLYRRAKARGYAGTLQGLMARWKNGFHTWAALLAPMQGKSEARKKVEAKRRDHMRAVIAELDARKMAMGMGRDYEE